ncbi:MAG: phosphate ABC transporter permease subunit PstC [Microbacteriaceae bacterium]|jgi:phosphate transport system permease protein|nr:phosphate ABC transporter permease subunit PstC [Microbacteriaceae bacterium]
MTAAAGNIPKPKRRLGDLVFSRVSVFAGILILVVLAAVAVFLTAYSLPAFFADPKTLSSSQPTSFWAYVAPLAFGTVWAAFLALLISLPFSILVALFVTQYAPRRLATIFGYIIDILAAVPSVVFGLWGIVVLAPSIVPVYTWISDALGWIPLFSGPVAADGRTILTAAIVLAIMILPIMTAMCREVFDQTPRLHIEAALALGATRWEMVKTAVLPFGRPGIIAAAMLVLSPAQVISFALFHSENPNTIAANIALNYPESSGIQVNALMASGLILFVITILVNMLARWIVRRRAAFSGAN